MDNAQIQVSIYLYGLPSSSKQVGKILSKAGLFLQHPKLPQGRVKCENPHYLKIPTAQRSEIRSPTPPLERVAGKGLIESLLNDLDQQSNLNVAHVNESSHQDYVEKVLLSISTQLKFPAL